MFLNTERPYGADNSKVEEASKDEKASAQTSSEAPKSNGARRYIGKNEVFLYESPTMASDVLRSGHFGEEVTFLGEKKKTNGFAWAKVSYNGKVGWVKADDLRIKMSTDTPHTVDLTDHKKIKEGFASAKHPESDVYGDFDNFGGLQCVDATNWFINTYTTLERTAGSGWQKVENIAMLRPDLEISKIPSAPAVYSIAPGKPGPGVANLSDSIAGHTGIVLDVKPNPEKPGEYILTVFHTYSKLPEKYGRNSDIKEYKFVPNDGVTFVNVGKYMK